MHTPRVVIAGGTGAAGKALTEILLQRGYRVTILTRTPRAHARGVRFVAWDARRQGPWTEALKGADGLVNLIGAEAHDPGHAAESLASVRALATAMEGCACGPPVWLQASSLAVYAPAGKRGATEISPLASTPAAQACRALEEAFLGADLPRVRRAIYRLGMVLGDDDGARERVSRLAQCGENSANTCDDLVANWIDADDLARILYWGLRMEIVFGPYNACVPEGTPLPAFAAAYREAFGHEDGPESTVSGSPREPLVKAVPRRLLDIAYQFRHEALAASLHAMDAEAAAPADAARHAVALS